MDIEPIPLNRPTEFISELEVEPDRSARSLCRGVNIGLECIPFRRRFPKGL